MPRMRQRLRSELPNNVETVAILTKIAGLVALSPHHLVIQKGPFRINASLLSNLAINPTAGENGDVIQFERPHQTSGKTATEITVVGDTGAYQSSQVVTNPDNGVLQISNLVFGADGTGGGAAGTLNDCYFTFQDHLGTHKYYVWFNINSAGTDPAPGGYTAGIEVSGATGATAATLATAAYTALGSSGAATYFTFANGSSGHLTITAKKLGPCTSTADATSTHATNFAFTQTLGVVSSIQSAYFTFSDAKNAINYYAWFNVNSEGVDPALASHTAVPIAVTVGASASTIGGSIATAIAALESTAAFSSSNTSGTVVFTTKLFGATTATADGAVPTDFAFSTLATGVNSNLNSSYFTAQTAADASKYYFWFNVNSQGVDPAPAGFTGEEIDIATGATAGAVVSALTTVIDTLTTKFTETHSSPIINLVNYAAGPSEPVKDGTAPTGFSFLQFGGQEEYDYSDIQIIRRLRTKKWLIKIKSDADQYSANSDDTYSEG